MSKKSVLPTLNLKGDDFQHLVPEDQMMELIIHWKGGAKYHPEHINPVHAFAKQGGKLKIINRNLLDTCYTFDLKEISKVYLLPMGV
ncbi:MAG: hypothetical protein [Caudoviricetes sp.]|nr:MAG: hypothetical protein [Caudoviricetes sp.]